MFLKSILLFLIFSALFFSVLNAQGISLAGYVVDAATGEKLIGATVYDLKNNRGVVSNEYGFFSLKTTRDYNCSISFVGYQSKAIEGYYKEDSIITIKLNGGLQLEEVTVAANRMETFHNGLSEMKLNTQMMTKMPALLGESDVLKVIQLQPGTQTAREGSTGFSVRGGNKDQNLFLLDGIPVYNVNHLFGFFSVFSPYAINSATYIKGAMPARYGGRLSSVVDLRLKEGNNEKLHGQVKVGIIASSIAVDGPLIKDKCNFIITARRTYLDLLSRPISLLAVGSEVGYYFQDFTFKTNYVLNESNKLFLSVYGGNDKGFMNYRNKTDIADYRSNYSLGWGNRVVAFRWNSIPGQSVFFNTTLYYSKYEFNNGYKDEAHQVKSDSLLHQRALSFFNNVIDLGIKWDLDYYPVNQLHIKTGIDAVAHSYMPGASEFIDFDASTNITSEKGAKIKNIELSTYAEANYTPFSKVNINVGIRSLNSFLNGYTKPMLQPRLLVKYIHNSKLSLSTSYDVNVQNVHLVSNSSFGAPTDLWLPVMEGISPQRSKQFTIGANCRFNKVISMGVDFYQKEFSNVLEFNPTEIIDHNVSNWADVILTGSGTSKGMELMLEKSFGSLTGWIAYTLSKSDRLFEEINNGDPFPSSYDRRHNVSVVGTYKINDNKELTASWVYTSGFYVTMNYNFYMIDTGNYKMLAAKTNARNNFQTPPYHRLDLSYSVSKQREKGLSTWSYGLYNAYNRINPFYVYKKTDKVSEPDSNKQKDKLIIQGMFPIIPSISYRFSF
ncbi:MAG: carboxypeptidase-like regulatory domain-containing protein [Prolixibacteraceae bacterium]|jgi:hypothetical protein|nr:carboxypeptidase-like regulatory domain-containing protein [Prolixibacteraceae bacterium]